MYSEVKAILENAGASELVWLPGSRDDIPQLLRCFDIFVLPSLAEGISNTILEAMASGLPVVATKVGGNSELVSEGVTGMLVSPGEPLALAAALHKYIRAPHLIHRHGGEGRKRVKHEFDLKKMVHNYMNLYDKVLTSQTTQ